MKLKFLVELDMDHPAFEGREVTAEALKVYLVGSGKKYREGVAVTELEEEDCYSETEDMYIKVIGR